MCHDREWERALEPLDAAEARGSRRATRNTGKHAGQLSVSLAPCWLDDGARICTLQHRHDGRAADSRAYVGAPRDAGEAASAGRWTDL